MVRGDACPVSREPSGRNGARLRATRLRRMPAKGGRDAQKTQKASRLFSMPRRKKRKFSAAKEAKRQARVRIGSPPAERVLPDKRKKAPKHKKTFDLDEF